MERKHVKVWCDLEGDYLEVTFELKEGYFRETANEPGDGKGRRGGERDRIFGAQSERP